MATFDSHRFYTDILSTFPLATFDSHRFYTDILSTFPTAVEEIHSVSTINNVETSYFTQLKMCCLMTTFRCPSDILITCWLFIAGWSTWPDFSSHHPLNHKLAVIRTLLERCYSIVTKENDRKKEEHVAKALSKCGYPAWTINRVKQDIMETSLKDEEAITKVWLLCHICERTEWGICKNSEILQHCHS